MLLYSSMPPLPSVPGVLLVVFKMGLVNDEDVINRIHLGYTGGPPTFSQLNANAFEFSGNWGARIAPNMHSDVSLTGVEITDLSSPTAASGSWTGVIGGGASTGSPIGAGSAVRINRKILRRYRGGRPGVFLPLTSSAYIVDPQTLTGAYLTAIQAAWAGLEADCIFNLNSDWASTARSVSVSYYEGFTTFTTPSGRVKNMPKLRVGGPVVDNITGFSVLPRVASQRRRNLTRS